MWCSQAKTQERTDLLMTIGSDIKAKLKTNLVRIGYCFRPSFLIIGAQKAGTDALHVYLSKHPNIIPGKKKEIHFFDKDDSYNRGLAWYHNHFPLPHNVGRHAVTFEATPSYLYYPASTERIFSYDSRMKLITLLRDPVDRAFSAWNMFRQFCNTTTRYHHLAEYCGFDEVIRDEIDKTLSGDARLQPNYVRRGLYYEQLLRYFKYFERDQILIIDSRSLKNNTIHILSQVVKFLGLPEYSWHTVDLPLVHVRNYEESMSAKSRAILSEFYRSHNEKLYKLLGCDFGWQ